MAAPVVPVDAPLEFTSTLPAHAVINASNSNFGPGQTIANLGTVQVGNDGTVSFYNAVGSVDVVVDFLGWFDPDGGARFHALDAPVRVLDDRNGTGLQGPWGPQQTRNVPVGGTNGIPSSATGVILNATVTGGTAGSFINVMPAGAASDSSTVNFGQGETIANMTMVKLTTNGPIAVYNQLGEVDVIADVSGYFAPS